MTEEPLDEVYFKWLAVQVVNARLKNPNATYWSTLQQLYGAEFVWRIRNDDNRVADGKALRDEFLETHPIAVTLEWYDQGCSFLEMLITLARRLSFQTEGASAAEWFWQLLGNVGLVINDATYASNHTEPFVAQVLDQINNRTYDSNGRGGLFPLNDSPVDLRQVELWNQMNYYLLERS